MQDTFVFVLTFASRDALGPSVVQVFVYCAAFSFPSATRSAATALTILSLGTLRTQVSASLGRSCKCQHVDIGQTNNDRVFSLFRIWSRDSKHGISLPQALMPSAQLKMKLVSPLSPHWPSQEPPPTQQLGLPVFLIMPHCGHKLVPLSWGTCSIGSTDVEMSALVRGAWVRCFGTLSTR